MIVRRVVYWTAVLVAAVAMAGGALVARQASSDDPGPDTTVRAYFAALARDDAPAALALGAVPDGAHDLLTSAVLAEQNRAGALHAVVITSSTQQHGTATVQVAYRLRLATGDRAYRAAVTLTHRADGWRLDQSAVPVTVDATQAQDRYTFAGTAVPDRPTVMFPGALPVRFDTPNLQVTATAAAVPFAAVSADTTVTVAVEPTRAARATIAAQTARALESCLRGDVVVGCPAPTVRAVPGSLAGSLADGPLRALRYTVGSDAAGVIDVTGRATVAGRYEALSYDNVVVQQSGRFTVGITAQVAAAGALTVRLVTSP